MDRRKGFAVDHGKDVQIILRTNPADAEKIDVEVHKDGKLVETHEAHDIESLPSIQSEHCTFVHIDPPVE